MPSTVIPTLRYRDTSAMIEWLCNVVGFERHFVVEGEGGVIEHAELTLGTGMIMLGTERDDAFGALQKAPSTLGASTQSPYLIVPDADAVCARAKSAGAEIVMDIHDADYGGRHFGFKDPEGYLWNIGTYDPWAHH